MDRIIRRLNRFDRTAISPEDRERERRAWEEAELARDDIYGRPVYAATLVAKDSPSVGVFAFIDYDHGAARPQVNIPLRNDTPDEVIVAEYYRNATFFGEIDQERFAVRATSQYEVERLMAYLNKQTVGTGISDASEWFYKNFGINHLNRYGSVYAGSYGGSNDYGEHHTATFETDSNGWSEPASLELPENFARRIDKSLPHLSLAPLPKQGYLQAVQSTLPFLPRDWGHFS